MDIYKDSLGNFVCKLCGASHTTFAAAMGCVQGHKPAGPPNVSAPVKQAMAEIQALTAADDYRKDVVEAGTIEAAKRLTLSMIEDYEISRQQDLQSEKGRPGPMTMNLAKNAAEALGNLNKLIYGEKSSSLNVHVDAKKKSDIEALKNLLSGPSQPADRAPPPDVVLANMKTADPDVDEEGRPKQ